MHALLYRRLVPALLAGAALAACAAAAHAQAFPNGKTVTLVVPAPPGGGLDGTARLLAKHFTDVWHTGVIVENQPGADGLIATRRVAMAQPDGYTMLLQIPSLLLAKYNAKDLTFDPGTSLTAISELGRTPSAIAVSSRLPVHSVKELVAYCNAQATPCTWGYGQQLSYLYGKRMFAVSGIKDSTPVPYKGTAPVITDLMGGHITIGITSIAAPLPYHQQGGLRILAVNVEKRSPEAPEVPNFHEAGLNVPVRGSWYGLFVPRNTPPAVVTTIEKATMALAKDPEAAKVIRALGAEPVFGNSQEFSRSVAEEQVFLDDMVKQYSLK